MSGRAPIVKPLFPKRPWLADGLALLAGSLLPLSLAPFHFWWSSTIGLLLLFSVLQGISNRRAQLRWYLFGLGYYAVGASWVYVSIHTHGGASPFLAASLVLLFVAGLSLMFLVQGYIYQRWFAGSWFGLLGAFPALWYMREWVTTWILTGFPWALLGYGHLDTPLAGFAPVIGVLGTGYIAVLIAALLFSVLAVPGRLRLVRLTAAAVPLILGAGLKNIDHAEPEGDLLSVSLVQGNIPQETKWRRSQVQPILQRYTGLTETEWGRDIIIWPEAAVTLFRHDAMPLLEALDAQGKRHGSALLLGIPDRDEQSYFNSALVVGEGEGRYRKRHLVPFGEYVPLEQWLRGVIAFFDLPMSRNRPGPAQQTLLNMQGAPVALSICYEVVFPNLVRRDAEQAAFLVTISNDTWFGASIGPHQHLQMAQMRALENSRYLIRATNNGLTAVISPTGEVLARLPQFEPGVLRGQIQRYTGTTPYTVLGDWPLLLGLGLLCLLRGPGTGRGTARALQSGPSNDESTPGSRG